MNRSDFGYLQGPRGCAEDFPREQSEEEEGKEMVLVEGARPGEWVPKGSALEALEALGLESGEEKEAEAEGMETDRI